MMQNQSIQRTLRRFGITAALSAGFLISTQAVSVTLHPSNVGISSINVNVVGNDIFVTEVWTSVGPGVLQFGDLVPLRNYTLHKEIINNTGVDWNRIANELLDPVGQTEDASDPLPQPAFVPAGFSTSNDVDGLSFAQGSGIPRTSDVFPSLIADEASDVRDFLDFFGAVLPDSGSVANLSFGLRENFNTQQPFLLIERPNASSRPPVPDAGGTLALLALGSLATLAFGRKR